MKTADLIKACDEMIRQYVSVVGDPYKDTVSSNFRPLHAAVRNLQDLLCEDEGSAKRPLLPGSVIMWSGVKATVKFDNGGPELEVECDGGEVEPWVWELDGVKCKIISVPEGDKK